MRTSSIRFLCYILCSVFLFAGCQREMDEPQSINAEVQNDSRSDKRDNDCRQVMQSGTYGEVTYKFNKQGLVSEWRAYFLGDAFFKHEYNRSGKLKKAVLYLNDGTAYYTIAFFYNKRGQVNHEIWYDGSTTTIVDDVYYTFTHKGFVKKMNSEFLDYHVDYEHDQHGNLTKFTYYGGDDPLSGGEYTYYSRLKNPQAAIPGLPYNYYSINGVYAFNKWYSTSEKFIFWENGLPVIVSDQDPAKTKMTANKERLPINVQYFDKISGETIVFDFKYDNCESCKPNRHSSAFSSSSARSSKSKQLYNEHMLRDPKKFRK